MRSPSPVVLGVLGLIAAGSGIAQCHELSGYAAVEVRLFPNDPLYLGQEKNNASLALQPEYYHEWETGSSFTFVPFGRLDSADSRRTHWDIRELNFLWLNDAWEMRLGIGKVFWGVTEFVHLVDIINQTDAVEGIDGEEKLGQPMIHLSLPRDWGTLDMFVLPGFRERTFPGRSGRLRHAIAVDTGRAEYESGAEDKHVDLALRYSHTLGDWDFGIYYFRGTGREPTLFSDADDAGEPVLVPFYEQIDQLGLDVQAVAGNWLWKLEAIYRHGQGDDFFAAVGGFEYTMVNVASSGMDLGLVGEYAYDERGSTSTTAYQNDLMIGFRWVPNDAAGSELLAGFIQDLDFSTRVLRIEGSRRFGNNWRLSLESYAFFDVPEDDHLVHSIREDDFFRLVLAYYY